MSPFDADKRARVVFAAALALHALFLVSLATGFLNPLFVEASQGYGQASDFHGIYQAGANLAHGYSIYDSPDYLHEAPQVVPSYYFYRYLPPTAYGSALLSLALPPRPAYWAWVLINEALVALVVVSLLRDTRWQAWRRYLVAALWVGFFPLYVEQFMGQFSLTMAVLLWFLWRAEANHPAHGSTRQPRADSCIPDLPEAGRDSTDATRARMTVGPARRPWSEVWRTLWMRWSNYRWHQDSVRPWRIPIAWAASITLKSFSALLAIPYLRDGRWKRILAGAGITIAASLPYFLARPKDLGEFVRLNLTPFTRGIYKGSFGLQTFLRDLLTHLPNDWDAARIVMGRGDIRVGSAILLFVSVFIMLLALFASLRMATPPGYAHSARSASLSTNGPAAADDRKDRRAGNRHTDCSTAMRSAIDLALWVTVFFLVFKTVWEYHYLMMLPVLSALILLTGSRTLIVLAVLIGMPTIFVLGPVITGAARDASIGAWPGWFRAWHFSVKCVPAVVFFGWCLRAAWRYGDAARLSRVSD
ncbi:MAG: DUF2029 domain-containing protein [Candidatus Eisenbacteria bacterium]|nr:DUF2029 domain-containing protein [Candidatus Eisenbacteria bacterium]